MADKGGSAHISNIMWEGSLKYVRNIQFDAKIKWHAAWPADAHVVVPSPSFHLFQRLVSLFLIVGRLYVQKISFLMRLTISSHTDRAHKLKVGYFDMEIVSTLSGPPTPSIKSVNRESDLCSDRSHFLNHTDPSNGASVIWCWNPWNCTRGKEDQQDETLASLATQLPQCRGGHLSH